MLCNYVINIKFHSTLKKNTLRKTFFFTNNALLLNNREIIFRDIKCFAAIPTPQSFKGVQLCTCQDRLFASSK
jgi:hypothetical protein